MSVHQIFDREMAERFPAPDRLILAAGEEIPLVPASEKKGNGR
jgi:hypothetical protein